jgi:transcriptional regulator with XRE-family HTH domain
MNIRIRKLRKSLDLTQQAFAERIGLKQNTIALIESGKRNISTQSLMAICREFNVSEEWLRSGIGEMFVPESNNELDALVKKYHLSPAASIVIEKFIKMSDEDQQVLLNYITDVAQAISSDDKRTIDEQVADYRRQLEAEEKVRAESALLQSGA